MERVRTIRNLEDLALSKTTIADVLSTLTPEEFEVLWGLTDPENTIEDIAANNNLSVSQVRTIRYSLIRKAKDLF